MKEPHIQVQILGVPSSAGCRAETAAVIDQRRGPEEIRLALADMLRGYDIATGLEDLGDLKGIDSVPTLLKVVEEAATEVLQRGKVLGLLGGAHTLTLGWLRALRKVRGEFSFMYVDAHPDCMPRKAIDYGSMLFHAFEEGLLLPERTVFIGLRQIENPEAQYLSSRALKVFTPADVEREGMGEIMQRVISSRSAPWAMSLDLDAIDPTAAPGVTAPSPIGLSAREVLYAARSVAEAGVVGFDIVELCPRTDEGRVTARLAATLLREIAVSAARQPATFS